MFSAVDTAGQVTGSPAVATDADLVLALTTGDAATFGALYDRMSGLVAHNVQRLMGDASPSPDVIRSIFLEVCRDTSGFDPVHDSARTWVLTSLYRQVTGLAPAERDRPARTNETER